MNLLCLRIGPLKQPRVETPPVLEPPLPPDLIFYRVDYPHVPSGDIPTRLSPSLLRPDSAEDEKGGGGSENIDEEDPHNVVQCADREDSNTSRSITLEDPGAEAHQEEFISGSGSGSGDIIGGEGGIQSVAYAVEDFLLISAVRV